MNRPAPWRIIGGCLGGALVAVALCASSGCGQSGGWAYFLGFGRNTKVEPKYSLPEGKVLVLVDDPGQKVRWPRARDLLGRYLGEELLTHEAATAMISPDSLSRLRQMDPAFETYSAHAIAGKLNANTVIWLEVRDFFAPANIQDTSIAAYMTVSVKVLNARERHDRRKVRLWPADREGHIVETELKAIEVHRLKGEHGSSKELARMAALNIGRLFYEHTLGDLADEPG